MPRRGGCDELDRAHPLRIMLGELASRRTVGRVRLGRLSPLAVTRLAEPYGVDAEELYRKTAGNPFFVVEALAAGVEGIPDTVRDAVLARAARLSPEGAALLEAVAVVPPQAEPWLLEALAGEVADRLEECLASGMLVAEPAGVAFHHELARLAVEASVPPHRKLGLHRAALAALAEPPAGAPDLARLAHHAEAAGDADAVLRFAPAAAARAASTGSYREAAAQDARALRFGDRLPPDRRAELLERRSHACYLTDQNDAAVEAVQEALECRRQLGQRLEEGDALRWRSQVLWCPGRTVQRLRARPAAAIVARRLREGGAVRLPRGPRPATRRNPAGLTPRELEVLALLAGGLRYADIAARLVLSERTVGHHVGAILRKLGVHTRAEASAEAARLGLTGQDG